jgi:hypothetical protein
MDPETKIFAFDGLSIQIEANGFAACKIQPGNLPVNNAVRVVKTKETGVISDERYQPRFRLWLSPITIHSFRQVLLDPIHPHPSLPHFSLCWLLPDFPTEFVCTQSIILAVINHIALESTDGPESDKIE